MIWGPLRSQPIGRGADASVDTGGTAFDLRRDTYSGRLPKQVTVRTDALVFVGWGADQTPPSPVTTNSAYQEADTVVTYTLGGDREHDLWFYVWAVTTDADVRVSLFG